MRRVFQAVLIFLLVFVSLVLWKVLTFLYQPPGDGQTELVFEVRPGVPFFRVAKDLYRQQMISDERLFRYLGRVSGYTSKIRVGEYAMNNGLSPLEVLKILASGRSIQRSITFQEGLNMFEMADQYEQRGFGRRSQFLSLCQDRVLIRKLLGKDYSSLEGYLFPETYSLTKYTETKDLIVMMVNRFKEVYEEVKKQALVPMERHEHVTLASIVEKETGAPEERPLISSVFHNRLKKKMRLQSDPTILYGILEKTGKMKRNIQKKDILAWSKYNTYKIPALPVGPVSNPGKEALLATVRPESSPYLYFVSRNDGTHVFSQTYREHESAVKKFQLDRKARQGKSWRDRLEKK